MIMKKLSELDIEPIPFEIKELSREGHTPVNRSSENGLAYVIYTSERLENQKA